MVIKYDNCLNCGNKLDFTEDSIQFCDRCGWRNEINDEPPVDFEPIVIKSKWFDDYICQIAFPVVSKKRLKYLPPELREAVKDYFEGKKLDYCQYQNIYHNLVKANLKKLKIKKKRIEAKMEFARFFKSYFKKKENKNR